MSYIGNSLTQQSFTGGMDQFNGNASNTTFGLSRSVTTPFDVNVFVESVYQRPGVAYTVSANTITFTSAPSTGANNIVVVYENFTAVSIVPAAGSVTPTTIAANTIQATLGYVPANIAGDTFTGPVGVGTTSLSSYGPTGSLVAIANITSGSITNLAIINNPNTTYQGAGILLGSTSAAANVGATYLYHTQFNNGANTTANSYSFNISQRKTDGTYVANIYNVDYQNNIHTWYAPNTGSVVFQVDGNGTVNNASGRPILKQSGSVIQTQYVSSGTRVSTSHSGSFAEPSTNYRVTIAPSSTSSMIIVSYYIPLNQNSAANILTILRSFRSIGGTKAYNLTSAGSTNGSRNVVAGGTFRPQNGYDNNDMDMKCWQVIDFPGSTSAVSYGFESKPEGTNTTAWGYSLTDSSMWGWDSDIVIIAQEIAQ